MFKGNITAVTTATANTNIQYNKVFNTNCNTEFDGSVIEINTNGFYKVNATFNITGVDTGNITLTMYNNGVPVLESEVSATSTGVTDLMTLSIADVLKIKCACMGGISFRLSANATITNAVVTVEKLK